MLNDLPIHRPEATTPTSRLLLLFHGVGSSAEDLRPLGQALANKRPHDAIVCVQSPDPSDFGQGWQWFSVQGVSESNRPERVAAAMPGFVAVVRAWQRESGIDKARTTLIGFSQGAIMSLESTQQSDVVAAGVIAIAGRFARPPQVAPPQITLHLLHGAQDRIMPPVLASDAATRWRSLGGKVTLDVFPDLDHGIDDRVVQQVAQYLMAAES